MRNRYEETPDAIRNLMFYETLIKNSDYQALKLQLEGEFSDYELRAFAQDDYDKTISLAKSFYRYFENSKTPVINMEPCYNGGDVKFIATLLYETFDKNGNNKAEERKFMVKTPPTSLGRNPNAIIDATNLNTAQALTNYLNRKHVQNSGWHASKLPKTYIQLDEKHCANISEFKENIVKIGTYLKEKNFIESLKAHNCEYYEKCCNKSYGTIAQHFFENIEYYASEGPIKFRTLARKIRKIIMYAAEVGVDDMHVPGNIALEKEKGCYRLIIMDSDRVTPMTYQKIIATIKNLKQDQLNDLRDVKMFLIQTEGTSSTFKALERVYLSLKGNNFKPKDKETLQYAINHLKTLNQNDDVKLNIRKLKSVLEISEDVAALGYLKDTVERNKPSTFSNRLDNEYLTEITDERLVAEGLIPKTRLHLPIINRTYEKKRQDPDDKNSFQTYQKLPSIWQ